MNDAYRTAMDQARQDLTEKIDEIKSSPLLADILELHKTLNGLESLLKEPKTPLGALFNIGVSQEESSTIKVRFDEFVGLTTLDSAKKYLKKCPDARPFAEILQAIRDGGGKVDNEEELRTSLSRSTLDIIKIGDRYGLIEKYPHIKRGGKKKKGPLDVLKEDEDSKESKNTEGTEDPFE